MLTRSLRQWMLSHLSIRLRLALWYAALLSLTLVLFSFVVYGFAQQQIESSVDQELRARSDLIANALQGSLTSNAVSPDTTSSPTVTTTPTPKPSPTAGSTRKTPTPGSASATATAQTAATPSPGTPPSQAAIQNQLTLKVPALLKQLDLTFEVLDRNNQATYYAPNITPPGLPRNQSVINMAFSGVPGQYTESQHDTILRIWVEPIKVPVDTLKNYSVSPTASSATNASAPTTSAKTQVVWVVLAAKPLNTLDSALNTLRQLLVIGVIFVVFFTSLGGWLIAGSGLRPISRVTRTARAIAVNAHAAGLGRRVGYRGPRDEVGELASTFDDMLSSIEQVASAQRRFVADASHELRAPLTTIRGSLEFLRRAPDLSGDEQQAVLRDAYTEAERMTALVNDLLLLARADAAASGTPGSREASVDDQLRGRRELVELDQLALDVFRYGRAQLQTRPQTRLQLKIDGLEPVAAQADPGQLRQVMLILLDNAIKYTPAGGKVAIAVKRTSGRAAISISDTGIGIKPSVQPHIFERFYRGDQARERDEHGSGLGLAIAKWIVEAHNGEILVQSEPGKGATFTVLLPAVRRAGEPTTSVKVPAVMRSKRSPIIGAGTLAPLARLAGTVSRPVKASTRPLKKAQTKTSHEPAPHDVKPKNESATRREAKASRGDHQPRSKNEYPHSPAESSHKKSNSEP